MNTIESLIRAPACHDAFWWTKLVHLLVHLFGGSFGDAIWWTCCAVRECCKRVLQHANGYAYTLAMACASAYAQTYACTGAS